MFGNITADSLFAQLFDNELIKPAVADQRQTKIKTDMGLN
jgi:hypothetical protein